MASPSLFKYKMTEIQKTLCREGFWTNYNKSQTKEKYLFLRLLRDLTKLFEKNQTNQGGRGRVPASTPQMIFCMCVKVFTNTSARRVISDLKLCEENKYLNKVPSFNSVLNYFNNRTITRKLKYLIRLSSLPLAQLEDKFSVDASGIAERKYLPRWSYVRQEYRRHREYKKIHCIVGCYSNIVANVIVTDGKKADSPYFKKLLQEVSKNFDISEILADKGYLSRENLKCANDLGISPYIPFKINSNGKSRGAMIWSKMYKYFKENPLEFAKHYHMRNNAESAFFMIKQKFGEFVFVKNEISQINEILCKILCHNICVLIQELFLSDIDIDFFNCAKRLVA